MEVISRGVPGIGFHSLTKPEKFHNYKIIFIIQRKNVSFPKCPLESKTEELTKKRDGAR